MTHETRYSYDLRRVEDRDAYRIVILRYEIDWRDHGMPFNARSAEHVHSFVLTTGGWHEYKAYETFPSNVPEISGQELFVPDQVIDRVKAELEGAGYPKTVHV